VIVSPHIAVSGTRITWVIYAKRAWSQARRAGDPQPVEACKAPGPGSSHPEAGDRGGPCSNGYPGCGCLYACADHW